MDIGNVIAAVVVLAVLGAVFGFVLAVASKIFEVKKDPREEEILSHLAGANCGGCGFPGCAGCAAAILAGTAPVNACAPAGAENAAAIAKIMETARRNARIFFTICFLLSNFTGNSAGTVWMLSFYRSFAQKNNSGSSGILPSASYKKSGSWK